MAVGVGPRYENAAFCGARIRKRRKEQGLSLKALAKKADMSFQYLSQVEKGTVNTPIETLGSVAHALEIPLNELVGTSDARPFMDALFLHMLREAESKSTDVASVLRNLLHTLETFPLRAS
jgi:transcriptional regulator with XRE-family HTH domain